MLNKIEQAKIFIDTVNKIVDEKIETLPLYKRKKAVVQSLNDDNTANIVINGETYNNVIIRSGLLPSPNEVVWVALPDNATKNMFIDTAQNFIGSSPDDIIWENIINKPLSSSSDIDDATIKRHNHENKILLDNIVQQDVDSWNTVTNKADKTHSHDTYTYIQISPSSEWIINHNLRKMPTVTIVDSAGSVVLGEIQYVDENQIRLAFIGEFSGKAYLN